MEDFDDILALINSYRKTAIIRTALELQIFDYLYGNSLEAEELAKKAGASPRGIEALCDALVSYGILSKEIAGYFLTNSANCLASTAPGYVGPMASFLLSSDLQRYWSKLTEAVRTGGCADSGTTAENNSLWAIFAEGMGNYSVPLAARVADLVLKTITPNRVLDVGAGHGQFGIAIANRLRSANVDAVDWDHVLQVAEKNAARAGVGHRWKGISGNVFAVELDGKYDVIILANFLHHFSDEECYTLLRKLRNHMNNGAVVVATEFLVDDAPPINSSAAEFSVNMLVTTPTGRAFKHTEIQRIYRGAGLAEVSVVKLADSGQYVITGWKHE